MPNYFYTAKSIDGKTVTGNSTAQSLRELSQALRDEGLVLIKAVSDEQKNKKLFGFSFSFSKRISATEKILMTKNLSVMVATGLSLVSSLDVLARQAKSKNLKNVLLAVKEKINKGENLSSAMSNYPYVFSDFFLSMVQVGEESGTLEEVLKILSLQIEKEHKIKSEIQAAMIYPGIILALMLAVGMVIALFVLPKLKEFFNTMSAPIQFYTRLLIDFGQFSVTHWPILISAPIVLIVAILMALKTKTGKWLKDTLFLRVPIISSFVKKSNCAILIRSLSSLLGSGVPVVRSLEVASGTVANFYFKNAVIESLEKIKKGEKLSEALVLHKNIFPFGAVEMLQVGEETGKTSTVLKTLADFYEDELISATEKLSATIEPVLIIILGLAVGFFAFSIIQPMYSSLQTIY